METQKARELLEKYRQGTLSEEEKAILDSWYLQLSRNEPVNITEDEIQGRLEAVWDGLAVNRKIKRRSSWLRAVSIASAAMVLIALGITLYYSSGNKHTKDVKVVQDIQPGRNEAVLVLSDGSEINLSDAINGNVARQSGVVVAKVADGKLSYSGSNHAGASGHGNPIYNTIRTPRGGQFQVKLPDGTIVWLNAASSIKYPVQFAGKERRVELTGEGYFEVAREKAMPFVVACGNQEIQVLGTSFNVNGYSDEPFIKTTLLEGSVRVVPLLLGNEGKVIRPGEQTLLNDHGLLVRDADPEKELAWKNGDFIFNDEDFNTVLRQISRWYDVEFVNNGNYGDLHLSGSVSRSRKLSAVLEALEVTAKIKFQLEGRRVMVKD